MSPLSIWEQWRRIGSEALLMLGTLLTLISMSQADITAFVPDKRIGVVFVVIGFADKMYLKWRALKKSAGDGDPS